MKRLFFVFIAHVLALTSTFTVSAAVIPGDGACDPLWTNINKANCKIFFTGTDCTVETEVEGRSGTTMIYSLLSLYRETSSGTWQNVKTVDATGYSDTLYLSLDYTATVGTSYKAVLRTRVTTNGVTEQTTVTKYAVC